MPLFMDIHGHIEGLAAMNTSHPLRILGVFAHPDDESFCAGGTFAKYAAAGAEIMVVSATRGDAGQIRDARHSPHPRPGARA